MELTEKIAKLLEKAQSTTFEEEAQLFYNKAQELMRKYAIEEAELWKTGKKGETPIVQAFTLGSDKMAGVEGLNSLLHACTEFNRCQMWYTGNYKAHCHVAGFRSDVEYVELLYNSLRLYGEEKLVWASLESDEHHRTFDAGFWSGFANRIYFRLQEDQLNSPTSTALVLIDRKKEVDRWLAEDQGMRFGKGQSSGNKSYDGRKAGAEAANTASLNPRRGLESA